MAERGTSRHSRSVRTLAFSAALAIGLLTGCSYFQGSSGPAPREVDGLSVVAEASGDTLLIHTEEGDRDFVAGVNLADSAPGFDPGELPGSKADELATLTAIHDTGVRTIRIYTIKQPAFYQAYHAFNVRHPNDPLYLAVGVNLPDVERLIETENLADPTVTESFTQELGDAVAAVHGDLEREQQPGRSYGTWREDVSRWVIAYIPGIEVDGRQVQTTNELNATLPSHDGEYFHSTPGASPSERWYAARLDELATAEASYGTSTPVGFVNWATVDPITHPYEPLESEDLAGLDANNVLPTDAWPGGTMAVYDVYPYFPDFLKFDPELQSFSYGGRQDPYAGYVSMLRDYHDIMPLFIGEFGVPSSIGSAHSEPLERGQGDHSEQEAAQIGAELLQMHRDLGTAGGLLFAWEDEWFKRTWNTETRQLPAERRHLWHDPWTNEQYFGLEATDVESLGSTKLTRGDGRVGDVKVSWDYAGVTLEAEIEGGLTDLVRIAFDVVPGGPKSGHLPESDQPDSTADYVVVLDPDSGGQSHSREELDGVLLDSAEWPEGSRPYKAGWVRQQLILSRALVVPPTGEQIPVELQEIGKLRNGPMDPEAEGYDSRNTWLMDGDTLKLRLPWVSFGISDPSSLQALVVVPNKEKPGHSPESRTVDRVGVAIEVGDERIDTDGFIWEGWEAVEPDKWSYRRKQGAEQYLDLAAELGSATAPSN